MKNIDDWYSTEFPLLQLPFLNRGSLFSRIPTADTPVEVHLLDDHILIVLVWPKTNGMVQLYVHPDYNRFEYVFIDTGIKPVGILLSPQPTSMLNALIAPH